jgi:TonB-dependent starch-binding outer membrane protein SusC
MGKVIRILIAVLLFSSASVSAQQRTVSGRVTAAEDGSPLPGVNVIVQGTSIGSVTEANGSYSVQVSGENAVLTFSFIGYQTREVQVGNQTTVNVTLATDVRQLSEVVVVGYGTLERRELTGSISSISSRDIETLVTPSFDQQLAGRAPGVQVTTPGGILGQRPIIRVRGVNSLTSNANPLIVIDGVPIADSERSGIMAANPLANINPAEIESFEVLKDGASTAIYGSRAANGVILITTKRGTRGRPTISYNGNVGFNQEVNRFDLLNGRQFETIANEKRTNANLAPLAVESDVNTDWQDYIFRRGAVHQHNVTIGGGSETTNYFFSLGYTHQESPVRANELTRYAFRSNVDSRIGQRVRIGSSLSYSHTEINGLNNNANALSGVIYNATRMLPNVPIFNPDNTAFDGFNVQPDGTTLGWGSNLAGPDNNIPNIAFVLANNQYRNRNHRILGNAYGEVEIIDGLALRTQIGVDLTLADDWLSWDPRHGDGRGRGGFAQQAFNPAYLWNWQNTLNYQTTIGENHNLNVTIGNEYQRTVFSNFSATGQNFSDRYFQQQGLISGSYGVQTIEGGYFPQGFDSYFGRVNYNFAGRYLLSFTLRNDGISDLPAENRRGLFPGGAVGWRISEEEFFNSELITDLKVRASYAEVGNVNIGILNYAGGFSPVLYGPNAGIAYTRLSNRDLQWESSKKFNAGLNATIGPLEIEADYFHTNIDNLVLETPIAPGLGVPGNAVSRNVGSMYNRGFEFRLGTDVIATERFRWNTDFNYTYIRNRVTNLVSPLTSTYNRTEVGRSIAELYGFQWAGVNPANGNPMYYKADGSIVQFNLVTGQAGWRTFNPDDPGNVATAAVGPAGADLAFLGNTLPKWSGGWNNRFSFMNFDLEIFLRYSGGNYIMNETLRGLLGQGFSNNHASILNRWTEAGQQTDIPKLFAGQDANMWQTGAANSRFVERGDFLRVQNIILGYQIPATTLNTATNGGIRTLRVYAQVQNPLIFTRYSGLDPELNQFQNQLQFGVDWNVAPIIRTWSVGLNVGF